MKGNVGQSDMWLVKNIPWVFATVLILLLLGFICPEAQADTKLFPFEKDGKWGYLDDQGRVVINPEFIMAREFSAKGIAAVVDSSGHWAYVDTKGRIVIRPYIFDNGPDYFREGLARFTIDKKFGFFGKTGRVVIGAQFDFAAPFSEGLSAICVGCKEIFECEHSFRIGGKWGYIDKTGQIIIEPQFDFALSFSQGLAAICVGCKEALKAERPFERFVESGKWGYIDKSGNIAIPIRFERAGYFKDGKAAVKLAGEWIHIDRNGKVIR